MSAQPDRDCRVASLRDLVAAHARIRGGRLDRFGLVRWLRRQVLRVLAREGWLVRAQTAYGFELEMPVSNPHLMWAALHGRVSDPLITAALREAVRQGDVVVDGGANIGLYTLLCAGLAGSTGQVVAFEPHPTVARILRRNVAQAGMADRVIVEEAALSNQAGEAAFNWSESHTDVGSLLAPWTEDNQVSRVRAVRLDDYVLGMRRPPDVIKLDLEGGEVLAMPGMGRAIAAARCVILEVVSRRMAEQHADPAAFVNGVMDIGRFSQGSVLSISRRQAEPLGALQEVLAHDQWTNVILSRSGDDQADGSSGDD